MTFLKLGSALIILAILVGCSGNDKELEESIKHHQAVFDSHMKTNQKNLIRNIQRVMLEENVDWALFECGTIVILDSLKTIESDQQLKSETKEILKKYGSLNRNEGSTNGFSLHKLLTVSGWFVGGDDKRIYSFVHQMSVGGGATDEKIGNHGLWLREQDSKKLNIIHFHRRRNLID